MSRFVLKDVVYPPGCKEINEDLTSDDLVRRLNQIALAFQQMSQDDDNSAYTALAVYLVNDVFLEHPSRDARLLVACSVADVFRVYAPRAPYNTPELIKKIFMFFIQQLKGLQDPKETNFKRFYYLLENLAWVKSFNLCIELEDSQEIFTQLFTQIFKIVGDNHSDKVKNIMLDMLAPLILESDVVSNQLLKIVLHQIIEPKKSANKSAYWLASSILEKTANVIEPYIQAYFSHILDRSITGEEVDSDDENDDVKPKPQAITPRNAKKQVSKKQAKCVAICEMIYELYQINPNLIQSIFHLVEAKLKENDDTERTEFTKLLARLFSDKDSKLAATNPELWKQFLGRFRDISPVIRCRIVQYSMHFLINHPELKADITEQLIQRQLDKDENVRYEVILSIVSAGKKGINNINEKLLELVVGRSLDTRFKIRREVLLGMAQLYKQYIFSETSVDDLVNDEAQKTLTMLSSVKNKCMQNYVQGSIEDKLLVERILITCLVPFQLPLKERMRALYMFYCSLEQKAAKAFNEVLKQQQGVRRLMKDVMDVVNLPDDESEEQRLLLKTKIVAVAKNLTEPVKAEEYITRLVANLQSNEIIRSQMNSIITSATYIQLDANGKCIIPPTSSAIETATKDILKSLGFPVQTNSYYMIIKQLMERISPIMIDHDGLILIFNYVSDSLIGDGEQDIKMGLRNSAKRGLELILILSQIFPAIFYGRDIFNMYLLPFLWQCQDNSKVAEIVMQILTHIGNSSAPDSDTCLMNSSIVWWAETEEFIQRLTDKYILNANTTRQAKFAIRCLNNIIHEDNKRMQVFADIIDKIKEKQMSLESTPHLRFHLVALGQIAINGGHAFFPKIIRTIIQKYVVQGLILKDSRTELEIDTLQEQEQVRKTVDYYSLQEHLSIEVKTKIEAIKLLVRWIHGLKLNTLFLNEEKFNEANAAYTTAAKNTFRLLKTMIENNGDINGNGLAGTIYERAFLRLTAGLAMLKIASFDALTTINSNNDHVFGKFATTLDIMTASQWHTLSLCLLDSNEFVKERFLTKLNKGLYSLNLGLEFLAFFALGGVEENPKFRGTMMQLMLINFNKRREVIKSRVTPNSKAVMPDCVLPYMIHLLAHMPFYTNYSNLKTPELDKVQACMWFMLEPLVTKNEHFSFSFFKKTFDNIKLCVDRCSQSLLKTDPKNEEFVNNINLKIYCICDIGLGLVMSKTSNFLSKEFPIEPSLPAKYFTALPPQSNMYRCYLPQDMSFAVPKRCELEAEVLGKVTKGFSQARVKSPKTMRAANMRPEPEQEAEASSGEVQEGQIIVFEAEGSQEIEHIVGQEIIIEESAEEQPPKEASENGDGNSSSDDQVSSRKRGRTRRESSPAAAPSKVAKTSQPAPPESPARKSSRLSTRKPEENDDGAEEDAEEAEEEEEEEAEPQPRRGRGRPKRN